MDKADFGLRISLPSSKQDGDKSWETVVQVPLTAGSRRAFVRLPREHGEIAGEVTVSEGKRHPASTTLPILDFLPEWCHGSFRGERL